MDNEKYQIGMVGLGVMGKNLALNIEDNGYSVVGYDKNEKMIREFNAEAEERQILGVNTLENMINLLEKPRVIIMMVPAGPPVDTIIRELSDKLDPGDILIDSGNSHFVDTELREKILRCTGIEYLGVGISGGEEGARHGPSIMPGGSPKAYQRVKPIFEAAAAQAEGTPCVTYLGPKGAGHYVKMVHNGIEYGLMQLIAESYDLMKRGLQINDKQIQKIYRGWNQLELNSYLIQITADIFSEVNQTTDQYLVGKILDEAEQKGTGKWTSRNAMNLHIPVPNIDAGVTTRNLSQLKDERELASKTLVFLEPNFTGEKDHFLDSLRMGLYAAMILTFAQGFSLLRAASENYEYHFDLASIAHIWRGGCIIRTSLLNEIHAAYKKQPNLTNLLLDPDISEDMIYLRDSLVTVVSTAAKLGIPAPGFMVALAYLDGYRSAWLPANLIQAQRDYFGAHGYERIDQAGIYHHDWTAN